MLLQPYQGHDAAWNGQGPESLLLHVMLEVAEALSEEHLPEMLDQVRDVGQNGGGRMPCSFVEGCCRMWLMYGIGNQNQHPNPETRAG